jgi:hypothetical protein
MINDNFPPSTRDFTSSSSLSCFDNLKVLPPPLWLKWKAACSLNEDNHSQSTHRLTDRIVHNVAHSIKSRKTCVTWLVNIQGHRLAQKVSLCVIISTSISTSSFIPDLWSISLFLARSVVSMIAEVAVFEPHILSELLLVSLWRSSATPHKT